MDLSYVGSLARLPALAAGPVFGVEAAKQLAVSALCFSA
jgi:hypothetical protein